MKLTHRGREGTGVVVILSRRNLLALLHKLEMKGSARTITTENGYRADGEGTLNIAHTSS